MHQYRNSSRPPAPPLRAHSKHQRATHPSSLSSGRHKYKVFANTIHMFPLFLQCFSAYLSQTTPPRQVTILDYLLFTTQYPSCSPFFYSIMTRATNSPRLVNQILKLSSRLIKLQIPLSYCKLVIVCGHLPDTGSDDQGQHIRNDERIKDLFRED